MKSGDVIKKLEADGWKLQRVSGSHHIFAKGVIVAKGLKFIELSDSVTTALLVNSTATVFRDFRHRRQMALSPKIIRSSLPVY